MRLLIVGGTAGIGLEIARTYAERGWSVVLAGRDAARAKSVAAESVATRRGIAVDLVEPEQIADAVADVDAVDHIVLSRDRSRPQYHVTDYDIAAARYLATMKLVGYTAVLSALHDRLAEDGSVVLFGGRAKDRPYPGSTTVSTVNGGVSGLVRSLAVELAPLRVNAIHPGIVGDSPVLGGEAGGHREDPGRQRRPDAMSTMADIIDGVDFLIRNRSVNGIDLYHRRWLAWLQ